jgi:hypothetical protein
MPAIDISNIELGDALNTLKPYQKNTLLALIEQYGDEGAAEAWLSSGGPDGMTKFGGSIGNAKPFWEAVKKEFKKLICGDTAYDDVRSKIEPISKNNIDYAINFIALSVATSLAVPHPLIVPVIAILIHIAGKVTVRAWCAMD